MLNQPQKKNAGAKVPRMDPYQLVVFEDSAGKLLDIDCVPDHWLHYDSKTKKCVSKFMPPPYTPERSRLLDEMVKECRDADADWPKYEISLRGQAKTYEEALDRLAILQKEQHVYTTDDDVTKEAQSRKVLEILKNRSRKKDTEIVNEMMDVPDFSSGSELEMGPRANGPAKDPHSPTDYFAEVSTDENQNLVEISRKHSNKKVARKNTGTVSREKSSVRGKNHNLHSLESMSKSSQSVAVDSENSEISRGDSIARQKSHVDRPVSRNSVADSGRSEISRGDRIGRQKSHVDRPVSRNSVADSRRSGISRGDRIARQKSHVDRPVSMNSAADSGRSGNSRRRSVEGQKSHVDQPVSRSLVAPQQNFRPNDFSRSAVSRDNYVDRQEAYIDRPVPRSSIAPQENFRPNGWQQSGNVKYDIETIKKDMKSFKSDFTAMKNDVAEIKNLLTNSLNKLPAINCLTFDAKYDVNIPFETAASFVEFSTDLEEDEEMRKDFIHSMKFSIDTSTTISKSITSILKKYLVKHVAIEYTATRATTTKKVFKATRFCKCMLDAFLLKAEEDPRFDNFTEKLFISQLSAVLGNVRDWDGTREHRRAADRDQ